MPERCLNFESYPKEKMLGFCRAEKQSNYCGGKLGMCPIPDKFMDQIDLDFKHSPFRDLRPIGEEENK